MIFRYLKFSMFLCLTFVQLSSTLAQQCFIYSGKKWNISSVTYRINSNLGDAFATQIQYETSIYNAAQSWNNAGANFQLIKGTNVDYERGSEPINVFQVGKYYEFAGPLGWTDRYLNADDPTEIKKACSYFNSYYFWSVEPDATNYDIESNILHEFGHWLALLNETNPTCYTNVMYEGFVAGTKKRILSQDDKNGILFIYGQNPILPLEKKILQDVQPNFFDYEPEFYSLKIYEQNHQIEIKDDSKEDQK